MIVWGGQTITFTLLNTGGRYCAQSGPTPTPTASPTPTPTVTATPYSDAETFTDAEAAPDSTPPALITQMIPKLRPKMGSLFRFRIFAYPVHGRVSRPFAGFCAVLQRVHASRVFSDI